MFEVRIKQALNTTLSIPINCCKSVSMSTCMYVHVFIQYAVWDSNCATHQIKREMNRFDHLTESSKISLVFYYFGLADRSKEVQGHRSKCILYFVFIPST